MKLQSKLSILALLASASISFVACNDSDDNQEPTPVPCEEDPTQEGCEEPAPTCDEDPTQEGCELDCAADLTQEGCESYCDENPTAIACLPTECAQVEAPVIETCVAAIPGRTATQAEKDAFRSQADAISAHAFQYQGVPAFIQSIEVEALGNEERVLTIDARLGTTATAACQSWVYVDLANNAILNISDEEAKTNSDWHIALKRTEIRTNNGQSGPSHAVIAETGTTEFNTVTCLLAREFTTQEDYINGETCEVRTFGRGSVDTALAEWYNYNMDTHTLESKQLVYGQYFVGGHGKAVKFQIESVTNNGVYKIRVAPIAATGCEEPA